MIVAADDRRRPSFTHPTVPVCSAGRSGEARVWQASPSVARIFRFRIQTCARWRTCSGPPGVARGGMQVAWRGRSHLEPPAQAQVAHVLQPSSCGEGGGAGGLEGAEATCCHLPRPRWRTCSSPPRVARGAGQVAWRGPKPLAPPERSHGHRRRLESTPGAFCTVLPMATGGVSHLHLLQVLFARFCPCPQAA